MATEKMIKKTKQSSVFISVIFILLNVVLYNSTSIAAETDNLIPHEAKAYPVDLLKRIRQAANAIPGHLPQAINYIKLAESHRTYAGIIEGGSDETFISARTAFQINYPDSSIMIDSGMDETVHRFYGFGRDEPYWADKNKIVQTALQQASLIIITHEHGDHIAGVLRSDYRDELSAKTLLSKDQIRTLIYAPQLPEISITPAQADDYIVLDYELFLPVAPGIVLIKSPGHTHGHQMVYVQLTGDNEYLFIGDIGWSLDNITQLKLRPKGTIARVKEDPQALMHQMAWIKQAMEDGGLIIIPSHDDRLLQQYLDQELIGLIRH
jgi:glyoxylase-like metal-dependent hydrolase (beta-lactamase superfamily II)